MALLKPYPLNEEDRPDIMFDLLMDNRAMLIVLLDRERERMTTQFDMTSEEAQAFLAREVKAARLVSLQRLGLLAQGPIEPHLE